MNLINGSTPLIMPSEATIVGVAIDTSLFESMNKNGSDKGLVAFRMPYCSCIHG